MQCRQQHVNQLDPDERRDHTAYAVDQDIVAQQACRAQRTVWHAAQSKWDEGNNDQRVEDYCREDRGLGFQLHNVEHAQYWIGSGKGHGDDRKIFRYIVRDAKRSQRAACHQQLLADLNHFNEFGWVAVQVHHVGGFTRRLCAGFIATATSAWASAGASFVPSPVIATNRPPV